MTSLDQNIPEKIQNKGRIASIDILRVIAIFAVICIHSTPFKSVNDFAYILINQGARFGIPLLFIVSGYFFTLGILKTENIHKILFRFTVRITVIFIFGSFLYLFNPEYSLLTEYGYSDGIYRGFIKHLKLIVSEPLHFLLSGTAAHLWFLPSLVIGTTILYLFLITGQKKKLIVGSIFLYVIGLLAGSYSSTPLGIEFPFNSRLGPFFSTIYIVIGWWLAHYRGRISVKTSLLIMLSGFVLHMMEVYLLKHNFNIAVARHDYLIGTVLYSSGIMLLALAKPDCGKGTLLERWGKYTLGIYIIHLAIVNSPLIWWLRRYIPEILWQLTVPLVVYVVSLILAVLFYKSVIFFQNIIVIRQWRNIYSKINRYIKHETFFQVAKFGLVGFAATMLHVSTYIFLIESQISEPLAANFLAYSFAFSISFLGHYHWTFNAKGALNWKKSFAKFIITSLIGLGLNTLTVFVIVNSLSLDYLYSAIIMVTIVPATMFVINKTWSFA